MPYDLYGNYYAKEIDAINAEMAQCAAIDADIANRRVAELERKLYEQQHPTQQDYELNHLWQKIQELEQRVAQLEARQ